MRHIHHTTNYFSTKTLFWLLCLIFLFTSFAIYKQLNRQKQIDLSNEKIKNDIVQLEAQNKELEQLIAYFSSSEFVEKEAREKLNMAKPGEKTLVITQDKNTIINNQEKKQTSNPLGWWQYFFGK
ncbi:MAG TPA: septum formation initiator family protein [bacterium]|nr:septum formation initiator family protein [bacterium]HPL95367.1 septum formation initiator family protein [bacterium]